MPLVGFEWRGKQVPFDKALKTAVKDGHWQNMPPALIRQIMKGEQGRDPYSLSPSTLARCIRRRIIERDYDYVEKPAKLLPRVRGNAWHHFLDEGIPGQSEQHLAIQLEHRGRLVIVGGTKDYYEPESERITDYKTKGQLRYWSKEENAYIEADLLTPEYELQVNMYALLCEKNNLPVKAAQLSYVSESLTLKVVEVPLWTSEEQWDVLMYFVDRMVDAMEIAPELPAPFEKGDEEYFECEKFCQVREICQRLAAS